MQFVAFSHAQASAAISEGKTRRYALIVEKNSSSVKEEACTSQGFAKIINKNPWAGEKLDFCETLLRKQFAIYDYPVPEAVSFL